MKFYSKIVSKPNSVFEEVKSGTQVIRRDRICTFYEGVVEVSDPKVIAKLKARPDMFRTDRPWNRKADWRITKEGKELLEEGKRLGIDCRHVREWYLKERIQEILHPKEKNVPEAPEINKKEMVNSKPPELNRPKVDYKAMIKLAKEAGIRGHGIKKEILRKKLKESGVNV